MILFASSRMTVCGTCSQRESEAIGDASDDVSRLTAGVGVGAIHGASVGRDERRNINVQPACWHGVILIVLVHANRNFVDHDPVRPCWLNAAIGVIDESASHLDCGLHGCGRRAFRERYRYCRIDSGRRRKHDRKYWCQTIITRNFQKDINIRIL